ncbi:hypothetical protein AWB76_02796 [Caballeronia temeraria]|uniref:Uncharacterized protein n=1 Tax=Caballeronia temeraria TaxID=1777137 RepID=A0A158APG7_9BURK|nr:hypothetical protein [Caballeronia temeraria]SAK59702.1 hypothetical protein AWB76_02796 [Caballeronia temeraria]
MERSGIRLCDKSGVSIDAWNNSAFLLSQNGLMNPGNLVRKHHALDLGTLGFIGIAGIQDSSAASGFNWSGATGTFFYRSKIIWDVTRQIERSQTSAEATYTPGKLIHPQH